jgi:hypothetical protein
MVKTTRVFAALLILGLAACDWAETKGDFKYTCKAGGGMADSPSCKRRLTDHYLLRYGEGSGDHVVLAWEFSPDEGRAALIDSSSQDIVTQVALDDRMLAAKLQSGRIYVAPANASDWPSISGPFDQQTFAARFANPPKWRAVQ